MYCWGEVWWVTDCSASVHTTNPDHKPITGTINIGITYLLHCILAILEQCGGVANTQTTNLTWGLLNLVFWRATDIFLSSLSSSTYPLISPSTKQKKVRSCVTLIVTVSNGGHFKYLKTDISWKFFSFWKPFTIHQTKAGKTLYNFEILSGFIHPR